MNANQPADEAVHGQHFFVVAPTDPVVSVLARMRDEACPVAVVCDAGQVTGVVDAGVAAASVLGQPARWNEPVSSVAGQARVLPCAGEPARAGELLGSPSSTVVLTGATGQPVAVITRADWIRYLNRTRNTSVFNPLPFSDKANV